MSNDRYSDKKNSGSYYTPTILADFVIKHVSENYLCNSGAYEILEPSSGDGEFLKALCRSKMIHQVNGLSVHFCEKDFDEYNKSFAIGECDKSVVFVGHNCDFLDFQDGVKNKYNFIMGNPPYIDKRRMAHEQIEKCKDIFLNSGIKVASIHNIWTAFVVSCVNMLNDDGVLAFVLPAEILQVNYTRCIRQLLLSTFAKIDIFAFNELIFDDIEQDVVLLVASKKSSDKSEGIAFYQVEKLNDLLIPEYTKKHSNVHRVSLDKWSNYVVSDDDLNFIEKFRKATNNIMYYCDKVEVGIVTGANKYFIISDKDKIDRNLLDSTKVIVTKGAYTKNCLVLTDEHIASMNDKDLPSNLVCLANNTVDSLEKSQHEYVQYGLSKNVHLGYKCSVRPNWYHVPSVWTSDAIFAKRTHVYPKIVINSCNVLVTDSFYRINCKNDYSVSKLSFCFYNTLTFICAELEGRYYGGGVLELTPNEFKKMPIPYNFDVSEDNVRQLNFMMNGKAELYDILDFTDNIILINGLGLSMYEVDRLRKIYKTLLNRRMKK